MDRPRAIQLIVARDLEQKMVFVSGPRQVGKTTLARAVIEGHGSAAYLSWDRRDDRKTIRAAKWPADSSYLVLDELHKMRGWKRWLKGEYDAFGDRLHILVTGSARLDVYRRGGDSLQGRYHLHRLHPFTVTELATPRRSLPQPESILEFRASSVAQEALSELLAFGGFPEPLFSGSERAVRRWRKAWNERFFLEDVRELEALRELSGIETTAELLAERVGSPLSLNALREDLEVSHKAMTHWLDILERLYFLFRIPPFHVRAARVLRKRSKAYLWDWSMLAQRGPRFENLVAVHLLKLCHRLADEEGFDARLHYLRDTSGHEVDFVVAVGKKPWLLVEAKVGEPAISGSLRYFARKLAVAHAYQVVLDSDQDFVQEGIRSIPAAKFLESMV